MRTPREQPFFEAQKQHLHLQRIDHGYLCVGSDPQVPAKVRAAGSLDIQDQTVLGDWFKLTKGAVVIDVGGYVGDSAYAFDRIGCEVYTFEPFLESFLALVWNTWGLKVHPFLMALGNGEKVRFNYDYADSDCGMLRVLEDPNGVETVRLDDVLYPLPRLDLIKVDCEGREIPVLLGASKIIQHYRPSLYVESFPDGLAKQGFTVEQLHNTIRSLGYTIVGDVTNYTSVRDLVCHPIP